MAKRSSLAAKKKVAIVTGGGTGIGRDIAKRLARDGFEVAVLGRRSRRLQPGRGEKLRPYVCDVADVAQIRRTVDAILADCGRIDVLVNAAGVVRREPVEAITQESIHYTIGINLIGLMNVCLAAVAPLKKTKGTIINISSSLTDRCTPQHAVYAASKGGINAFSKSLAVELAPHRVRVNVVSPSLVRSEIYYPDGMSSRQYEQLFQASGDNYFLLGRSGEPADVSGIVAYLASAEASWLTGLVIPVDGGESVGFTSHSSGWSK